MDTNFLQLKPDRLESIEYFIDEPITLQKKIVPKSNPFQSFWMGGFECTDKLNAFGNRVDLLINTGHLQLINEDYERLSSLGMQTVREGIRWSQVEKTPYHYDWSEVATMIRSGKENNIQQVWDLCHFGFPDDLTPLHPLFARRFASLCRAFVQFYRGMDANGTLIVTPINEVSFLSWLGGDVRGTSPYCVGQGWEVKYRLMKAYIEGVAALKEADPTIRILTTEPLVNIVAPQNASAEEVIAAAQLNDQQFQVTDILSGRICPELGGQPGYLDILGYNYYYNNQWETGTNLQIHWGNKFDDERFVPLHRLLMNAYQRYHCPIALTETSHPKEDRPLWIDMIADECAKLMNKGIPLWGICWYPVVDRPDWDHLHLWHQSGLWDGAFDAANIERIMHTPSVTALLRAQKMLQPYLGTRNGVNYNTQA